MLSHWLFITGNKNPFLCFLLISFNTISTLCSSPLRCLSSSVCECSACSDGCPVAGLSDFSDGSSWHWLVGHWHGWLDWALPEEPSVGCPVFAADRGHGSTAERKGQVPASGRTQCSPSPMSLLEKRGHREPWQPPVGWVLSSRQCLQGLTGLYAANVQGRDLDRLTWQLLVGQVLVQEAVQTLVDLFQVHLFVLQMERSHSRVCGIQWKRAWMCSERGKRGCKKEWDGDRVNEDRVIPLLFS